MLFELARHCPRLLELRIPMSDVSDRGLMALGGIAIADALEPGQGCFRLRHVGLKNCFNVTTTGVGCLLRKVEKGAFPERGAKQEFTLDVLVSLIDFLKFVA